jgi:hypothetical protein
MNNKNEYDIRTEFSPAINYVFSLLLTFLSFLFFNIIGVFRLNLMIL